MIHDPQLWPLWKKVQMGGRLSHEDGLTLFESDDLLGLGFMANGVKEKKHGQQVSYVVNRHVNPTNMCVSSCRFCDFARPQGHPEAYTKTNDDILSLLSPDIQEVHITGGLHPDWDLARYVSLIQVIKTKYPGISIKACTAVEIDYFSRRAGLSVVEVLKKLRQAGVHCLPGGGAEVFSERLRQELCPTKIGAARWLEIHRCAHQLGLRSNATLLYGHIETYEERVSHMEALRRLQDETSGFLSFVPLAYQAGRRALVDRFPSALEDLKTMAVARLFLDNFDHIKAYWVTLGMETASVGLHFGADDLDGTVGEEKIMHAAGATSPIRMARDRLSKLIQEAGLTPVERASSDKEPSSRSAHQIVIPVGPVFGPNREPQLNSVSIAVDPGSRPPSADLAGMTSVPTGMTVKPMPVGKISYLNARPFFSDWSESQFPLLKGTPRELAVLAKRGGLVAGPLPLVECWNLEDRFEPLRQWGIAVGGESRSVIVVSKIPFPKLNEVWVSVTHDSSTSVALLEVLVQHRFGHTVRIRRGFHEDDQARLYIGDEALRLWYQGIHEAWPYMTDLAAAWWNWQQRPFVFAQWIVRRDLPPEHRQQLEGQLRRSLTVGGASLELIAQKEAPRLKVPQEKLADYLNGFTYEFSRNESESIKLFRALVTSSAIHSG